MYAKLLLNAFPISSKQISYIREIADNLRTKAGETPKTFHFFLQSHFKSGTAIITIINLSMYRTIRAAQLLVQNDLLYCTTF